MLYKTAREITEADLLTLVEAGAAEDDHLEFKSQMYGSGDDDKRELVRDIISMANHRGGLILVGVEEGPEGAVTGVHGVEGAGHDTRVLSSAQANISPRLNGLEVVLVRLAEGRCVVTIAVPESLNGPHMTTYRGENRFWRRHGRQKSMMSVDEIEAAYMKRIDSTSRVEAFLNDRRGLACPLSPGASWLLLQAAPVFMRDEIVDINDRRVRALLSRPPSHPQAHMWDCGAGTPSPSLHGLRAEHRRQGDVTDFLELHREGYLEYGTLEFGDTSVRHEDRKLIPSTIVYCLVHSFAHLYQELMAAAGVSSPTTFALAILNCSGLSLAVSGRVRPRIHMSGKVWQSDHLVVPPVTVQDLRPEANALIRGLNDRLWNAFGHDRCMAIRDDGSLVTS